MLRKVKHDPRTQAIRVILTSSREEKDMVSGYQLGIKSYIKKPVDFGHFPETVKQPRLCWLLVNHPPGRTPADRPRGA